jgi:hypothetical protein
VRSIAGGLGPLLGGGVISLGEGLERVLAVFLVTL